MSTLNKLIIKNKNNAYYFSLLYARTLAGKLNTDLKANLNGHQSMCHSIQI